MKKKLKRFFNDFLSLWEEDPPETPMYDPVHLAAVVVGCLAAFGILYWVLWAMLVCEGGLFQKIGPVFQVLFTSKTLGDFGYEGYPYELGIFEGWIVNVGGLIAAVLLTIGVWRFLRVSPLGRKRFRK